MTDLHKYALRYSDDGPGEVVEASGAQCAIYARLARESVVRMVHRLELTGPVLLYDGRRRFGVANKRGKLGFRATRGRKGNR